MKHKEKFLHKGSLHNEQSIQDQFSAFHFENTKSKLDCNTSRAGILCCKRRKFNRSPNFEYLWGGARNLLELVLDASNRGCCSPPSPLPDLIGREQTQIARPLHKVRFNSR